MQFEGRRRTGQIPSLTPLIDIVFLLLVFFMLTSHFVQEQVLNIDLPEAESGSDGADREQIEVVIDSNGILMIDDQVVPAGELENILRQGLASMNDQSVRVRGDTRVALGEAISVMDAARKAGAVGVDIVTERK